MVKYFLPYPTSFIPLDLALTKEKRIFPFWKNKNQFSLTVEDQNEHLKSDDSIKDL